MRKLALLVSAATLANVLAVLFLFAQLEYCDKLHHSAGRRPTG